MELIYIIPLIHIVQYVTLVPILTLVLVTYYNVQFVLLVLHLHKVVVIVLYVYLDIIHLLLVVVSAPHVLQVNTIMIIHLLVVKYVNLVLFLPLQRALYVRSVIGDNMLIVLN